MGLANLKENLQRKFADWLGEKKDLEKHIADVTAAYEALGEKRDRLQTVDDLLASTKVIMKEIAPHCRPESVRPSRKNAMKLPFKAGEVTRMAFDVMRKEARPMGSRVIAELAVAEKGLDSEDRMLVDQVKIAVDASLRSKKGQFVDTQGERYSQTWFIIQGDRPMVFEFENVVIVVEVTLTRSSRQEAAESEPVRRHVAEYAEQFVDNPDKRVFGLFIAIDIDSNTAHTFRYGEWYRADDSKIVLDIVPMRLDHFQDFLRAGQADLDAMPEKLVTILKECRSWATQEAPEWKRRIALEVEKACR